MSGLYELGGEHAEKTGEWKEGIGRIFGAELPLPVAEILAPYLSVIADENAGGKLERYPGSPLIARRLLRRGDTLIANELHEDDGAELRQLFARDPQTKVMALDGWTALKSLLPPKERRGVVLIDPPFEEAGEFERIVEGLANAARRFATGTFVIWYPIKDARAVARFHRELAQARPRQALHGRALCSRRAVAGRAFRKRTNHSQSSLHAACEARRARSVSRRASRARQRRELQIGMALA